MIKLGDLNLNEIPRVAVALTDQVHSDTIIDAKKLGVDIIELRIDSYNSADKSYVLQQVAKFKDFPTIATIRSQTEGGGWNKGEDERLALFEAIIPHVSAIDIELSSTAISEQVVSAAHSANKIVVVSYHNFDKTPSEKELVDVLSRAKKAGADIVKIATLATQREDVQRLAEFTLQHSCDNLVTISMGSEGALSRILFPALGSLITYASVGPATAPGQFDYNTTFDLLRRLYPKYNEAKINAQQIMEYI